MGEKDIEIMAELIALKLAERQTPCSFSVSEQEAIKDLIRTKNHAVKAFLWVCGALVLWIIKDIYVYIIGHLTFK